MCGCLIHRYTSWDCMLHMGSGARQTEQRCSSMGAYGIDRGKRTYSWGFKKYPAVTLEFRFGTKTYTCKDRLFNTY